MGGPVTATSSAAGPGLQGTASPWSILHTVAGKFARTCDIAIVPRWKDGPGPLAGVYEWTGFRCILVLVIFPLTPLDISSFSSMF